MCPGSGSAAVTHRQSLVVAVAMAVPGRGIQGEYEIDAGLEKADDGNPLRHRRVDPRVVRSGARVRSAGDHQTTGRNCSRGLSRRRLRTEPAGGPAQSTLHVRARWSATSSKIALPPMDPGSARTRAARDVRWRATLRSAPRRRRTVHGRTPPHRPAEDERRPTRRVRVLHAHDRDVAGEAAFESACGLTVDPPGAGRHRDHHVRPAQAARALEFGDREARPGPRLRGRVETDVGPHAARVGDAGDEPAALRAQRRPRDERIRITRASVGSIRPLVFRKCCAAASAAAGAAPAISTVPATSASAAPRSRPRRRATPRIPRATANMARPVIPAQTVTSAQCPAPDRCASSPPAPRSASDSRFRPTRRRRHPRGRARPPGRPVCGAGGRTAGVAPSSRHPSRALPVSRSAHPAPQGHGATATVRATPRPRSSPPPSWRRGAGRGRPRRRA